MRYISTTDTNITFTDTNGKVKIVPKNKVYTHFNVDTVTFLLIERYDNEGICIFTTKAEDLEINGETYTYQELLDGEGINDLFSPTGLSFEVVEELPETGSDGVIYLVPNGEDSYTEYIWIENEQRYEMLGDVGEIDLTNYYTKAQVDSLIPTEVSELTNDAGYITQEEVIINESFPSGWHTTGTMADLITEINADSDAVVGKAYMNTVSFSDLPNGISQAELKVDVISELQGQGKVLVFTITSADVSPYHWEYTSAYGASGTWRSWANSSDLANYYNKTESNARFASLTVVNQEIAARIQGDADLSTAMGAKADKSDTYTKTQVDTALATKANSVDLATVATSGSYSDLSNTPDLTVYAESADLSTVATSGDYDDLTNKPTIPVVPTNVSAFTNDAGYLTQHQSLDNYYTKTQVDTALNGKQDASTAFSGDYDDLTNKPDLSVYAESADLATVATSGDYDDLTNKPTIPAAQVNSDWNASSGVAQILNKPDLSIYAQSSTLATVATSGDYDDLSNKPTIPTVPTNVSAFTNDAGYLTQHQSLANYYTKSEVDSELSTKQDASTAFSGDYNDLTNKPDLSVYAESTDLATVATSGSYNDLSNKPTIPVVPTNVSAFTNDAGYLTQHQSLDNYYTKTQVDTALNGKQDVLTAGTGISIQNNVISATGGGGGDYQFYTETDEEQEEGTTINRHKDGVIEIADEGGTTDSGMGTFFTETEEDGSISYTDVYSSMYANKDDGETVNGATIGVNYNNVSITVSEDGVDNGTPYNKYTDFVLNADGFTVEVSVDGNTETLELNDRGLSINGDNVLTDNDAYTKTEIDAMIGNINTILASI